MKVNNRLAYWSIIYGIEIKAKLSDDKTKYILIDGNISDGDKIAKNPGDILEGGTE